MANDPNWEPDGVTHQVRFCEGGGTYRQGFPPLLSTFSQGTRKDLTPRTTKGRNMSFKDCAAAGMAAIIRSVLIQVARIGSSMALVTGMREPFVDRADR